MHLVSCTNTNRDVTDLVNHGMVKNTKTWICWERNIIFLRNKKILDLCFRCHILRSYRFVAEVTFKDLDTFSLCHTITYRPFSICINAKPVYSNYITHLLQTTQLPRVLTKNWPKIKEIPWLRLSLPLVSLTHCKVRVPYFKE